MNPWTEGADRCIKCNLCMAACPAYGPESAFPGPKHAGPELWRLRLADQAAASDLSGCLNCHLCEAACPQSVPITALIVQNRAAFPARGLKRVRDRFLARPDRPLTRLSAQPLPLALARTVGKPLLRAAGVDATWPLPATARTGFWGWWRRWQQKLATGANGSVGIWIDCYSAHFDPRPAMALVRLLHHAGWQAQPFALPEGCCGAAQISSGLWEEAQALARRQSPRLEAWRSLPVLALNATCAATLTTDWPDLLGVPQPRNITDPCQFLLEEVNLLQYRNAATGQAGMRLAYHTTCRVKAQGRTPASWQLLRDAGLDIAAVAVDCCGMGGAHGVKSEHLPTTLRLAQQVQAEVAALGQVAGIVAESGPCAAHLSRVTGVSAAHPLVWLEKTIFEG